MTPRTRARARRQPEQSDRVVRLAARSSIGWRRSARPRDIAIIADEVFADYELEPGAAGGSRRERSTRDDVLSFALGGLSKSIGLPQVKLGWIAVAVRMRSCQRRSSGSSSICDTYLSVSTPVQVAAAGAAGRAAPPSARRSRRASSPTIARCSAPSPRRAAPAACCAADGGWYAVLQVPTLESEEDLVLDLLTIDGVLAHPGYFFDFPRESFLIVSLLAAGGAVRRRASTRLLRHFDCSAVHP